jgi:hypothetical protein
MPPERFPTCAARPKSAQISHGTLDCVIGFGHSQQLKGGIPFEDCGPVFDGPLLSHSHALFTPSRLARILLKDSASSLDLAMGYLGRALPFALIFLARLLRPSINRSSSAIGSGLLCFPPLWIQAALASRRQSFP